MPTADGKKTGSRSRRAPFVFDANVSVRPGRLRQIQVPLARVPAGTWASMPVVVVHGKKAGPTLWISGALHGDELNGIEIVRQVLAALDPNHLAGTVIAVPIVNAFGVTLGSRYLPGRRDLNRSFPGSARGSLAARIARLFCDRVVYRSDLGIDFHTGSNGRDNLPQIRCDLDDPATQGIAAAFHAPLMMHAKHRPGSLRAAAHARGVPVLLYEGGEADRFDSSVIDAGVAGALRVMHMRGMIESAPAPEGALLLVSRASQWERAGRSGFCRVSVSLGEPVKVGQSLARISDSISPSTSHVRARRAGIVISVLRTGVVHRGDAVVHVAETESSPTPGTTAR